MKQKLTLRRVLVSAVAALAAAAAVWLLCRWVGYDLQLRIGNEPVYEIANDDYTQIIDVPEDGLWQAVPLEAGQTLYGCRLRFSTHGELYRAGMVMVDLCDADGTILREAAATTPTFLTTISRALPSARPTRRHRRKRSACTSITSSSGRGRSVSGPAPARWGRWP